MDVAVITGLVKLVGDGLFAVIITLLYIMDKKKRDKEYKQEREILQNEYETMTVGSYSKNTLCVKEKEKRL